MANLNLNLDFLSSRLRVRQSLLLPPMTTNQQDEQPAIDRPGISVARELCHCERNQG